MVVLEVNDDPLLCRLLEEGSVLPGGKSDDEALVPSSSSSSLITSKWKRLLRKKTGNGNHLLQESLENCPHLKLNSGLIVPLPICTNHGNKVKDPRPNITIRVVAWSVFDISVSRSLVLETFSNSEEDQYHSSKI